MKKELASQWKLDQFILPPSSFILWCAAQHTSFGGFSSIRKRAFDKFPLVLYQTGRQGIQCEPFGAFYLHTLRAREAGRAATKNNFDMSGIFQRARKSDMSAFKFQARLLAQLAPQRLFRFFSFFDKSAG